MASLRALWFRLLLWDCDYAIQRVNTSLARQREELAERKARKEALKRRLFECEHQL